WTRPRRSGSGLPTPDDRAQHVGAPARGDKRFGEPAAFGDVKPAGPGRGHEGWFLRNDAVLCDLLGRARTAATHAARRREGGAVAAAANPYRSPRFAQELIPGRDLRASGYPSAVSRPRDSRSAPARRRTSAPPARPRARRSHPRPAPPRAR